MWADNETSEDLLGFRVHADLLLDVIKDETVLPVTIGVFGDWGSGKSSILKMIHEELAGDDENDLKDDTLVLYFNGWVFEGYDDAKAALLECILEEFQNHKRLVPLVKEKIGKLLKSVNWMRVLGFSLKKIIIPGAAAYMTGGLSLIPQAMAEAKKLGAKGIAAKLTGEDSEKFFEGLFTEKEEENAVLVREFRKDFEDLIEASKIKKLVVVIDDLDRCTPERIIENLEAIKLFLNVGKTAFLIGADPRIVRHAIELKYNTDGIQNADDDKIRNKRIVSDYLEKLIQVPYNLPRLSAPELETYVTLLLCKKELGTDFPKIVEAFSKYREGNRYGAFGFADIVPLLNPNQISKIGTSATLLASLSTIMCEGLKGNPRQFKRFLNTFTLRNRLVTIAKLADFRLEVLAKLMVLEYAHLDLFQEIYKWQSSQKGEAKELIELEGLANEEKQDEIGKRHNVSWAQEEVVRWLKVEPKLSGIDLRDYFWISRDQLASSIDGSSLIAPRIRSIFKKLLAFGAISALKAIVQSEILGKIGNDEVLQLLSLLEKELAKTPQIDKIHQVYLELICSKIPNALDSYVKMVKQVDNVVIPFSFAQDIIREAKVSTDAQRLYSAFSADSRIHKSLNPKKDGHNPTN